MKRYLSMNLLFLCLGVFALAMSVPQVALAAAAGDCSECLVRYSANHRTFCTEMGGADPCELTTAEPPIGDPPGTGGLTIYDKNFLARDPDRQAYWVARNIHRCQTLSVAPGSG